jgi:hypothetical protein
LTPEKCASQGKQLALGNSRSNEDPRLEIQKLFDKQIQGIVRQIDRQLSWMQANRSNDHVVRNVIILGYDGLLMMPQRILYLSGGLGGSPYVDSELRKHYRSSNITILKSQEPRLAVVKGLVMDRRQKLNSGVPALQTRM